MTMLQSKILQVTALVRMRLKSAIEDLPEDPSKDASDTRDILDHLADAMAPLVPKRTVLSYEVAIVGGRSARVSFKINAQQETPYEVEEAIPALSPAE